MFCAVFTEGCTEPVAVPASQPEERGLLRDWVMLLVWLGGAAILVLMHVGDLFTLLFGR